MRILPHLRKQNLSRTGPDQARGVAQPLLRLATAYWNNPGVPAKLHINRGGLVTAIALARRGIRTSVFERDTHPEIAPRFNPDRSYTIDVSGHGLKALRHIDACSYFDDRMIRFKGLKVPGGGTKEWTLPGWAGSRDDILRALMAVLEAKYRASVTLEYESRVTAVDVAAGVLTHAAKSGDTTRRFDLIIGADGAGSVVRSSTASATR